MGQQLLHSEYTEDDIRNLLTMIGEDPHREGLIDTPKRVLKANNELYSGYKMDPNSLLTTFDDDGNTMLDKREIIILKDIEFYSTCEHHMLPFYGRAHIAYIPSKKVIGISKLARLLDIFARRLQIQERIGHQVTDFLMQSELQASAAACVIQAQHFCMTSRGVRKQSAKMQTSVMKGWFQYNEDGWRDELFSLLSLPTY